MASTAAAQISIPFGGPTKPRPSPNATQVGAPVDVAAAVAAPGRSAAMRTLDDGCHPVEVLGFVGLVRGFRVLVVERDPGYFGTIVGAALSPDGKVTELVDAAVMASPATRAALSDAVGLAPNLALLVASTAVRLTPNSFDLVLLYRAGNRAAAVAGGQSAAIAADKLYAAVRPGGIVGVVEHLPPADGRSATDGAVTIERRFTAAGFVLDRSGRVRGADDTTEPALADHGNGASMVIFRFRKPE